jgi:hypothetical protein
MLNKIIKLGASEPKNRAKKNAAKNATLPLVMLTRLITAPTILAANFLKNLITAPKNEILLQHLKTQPSITHHHQY